MSLQSGASHDVVIIGGGFSGLSIAVVLANHGIPVTLLEAAELGTRASTINQGWLYSGSFFARRQVALAKMCHESYQSTIRFCPDCLEPGHTGMLFAMSVDSDVDAWTAAWNAADIPWQEVSASKMRDTFPPSTLSGFTTGLMLPDRSIQPQVLLRCLADRATEKGVRIHTGTRATRFSLDDHSITSVVTARGEEIRASLVIIATGAGDSALSRYLSGAKPGSQSLYTRVALQAHLIATPQQTSQPFCVPDFEGFNHLPHWSRGDDRVSVFGMDRWTAVSSGETHESQESEFRLIEDNIGRLFPDVDFSDDSVRRWSGTTVQAMHIDQVEPGRIPLPTVIDHALETPAIENLLSVYPGRATLWAQLAVDCAKIVVPRLRPDISGIAEPPWAV